MGLFSSKTKISVSSVAYNIAGDAEDRNNFLKQSLVYLTAADESVGERLPRMYLNSLGVKLKRAYKHAASLPQGLPTASVQLWDYQEFEDAVQTLLDTEHGTGRYKVQDAYITAGTTAPAIEDHLNRTYGYDPVTGLMANPPKTFAESAAVEWRYEPPQSSIADTSPQVSRTYAIEFRHDDASELSDKVVKVSLKAAASVKPAMLVVLVSEWLTTTRSDLTVSRPFILGDVAGTVANDTLTTTGSRETKTTTTVITATDGMTTTVRTRIIDATVSEKSPREYKLGTGEWPSLDSLWESRSNVEQTYFPSVPFRVDNKDMFDDALSETADQKASKRLVALMGMNANRIRDQINDNPSIKDIDYAFLVAGANMNTDSQAEMDYLFRFWDLCRERETATEYDLATWVGLPPTSRGKPKTNSLVIQDPESKNGAYKITIEWDYVTKVLVTGVIGVTAKVGRLEMVKGTTVTFDMMKTSNKSSVDSTTVSIRRQINATQYEELQISGAVHRNDVYQGKTVETLAKDSREDPSKNEGFIVPLHMGIFNTMPLTNRTQLAQECIYMVFNCYVKTKQKWYQSSAFKWILAIISIIIIVFTWGAATPAVAAAWGTAGAVIGISGALMYALTMFVVGYLVSYTLGKWQAGFVSVFGKKWAGVVMAIITIVVSAYTGGPQSSATWLQTAVKIIDIATQLFTAYAKGAMLVAKDAFDAFMDKAEEDKKLLDKLSNEFFGENDLVSIDYLLELQKTLREDSPSTFLSRTLMTGSDIVDITLGQVSEMASMTLNPRLQGI